MKTWKGTSNSRRKGIATTWLAVILLMVVGFSGLALDTGYVLLTKNHLQATADGSALAAARCIRTDITMGRQAAVDLALLNKAAKSPVQLDFNGGNAAGGDIVTGVYDRDAHTFTPSDESPNAVKVVARRTDTSLGGPLPLFFGPVFSVDTANVAAEAIAMVGGSTGAGLVTLNKTGECSLQMGGNNDLILEAAPGYDGEAIIQVNSQDACAACGSGSSLTLDAPQMNIVGSDCWNGNPDLPDEIYTGQPYLPDPLEGVPAPPLVMPDLGSIETSGTYGPGYYSGGIRLTSSTEFVVLEPGIYYVDGIGSSDRGLYVNGGNLTALEVMFYVVGDGVIYLGGNGNITITGSDDEANPYWHISIFQARDNTNDATIIGTSGIDLQGTIYIPSALLEVGGTGTALGNQLIVNDLWIHGTGIFTIAYDGAFPAPGNHVFLVE